MPVPLTPNTNHHSRLTGFTMVELVIVIVVIGILASIAGPRFFERSAFDERGYYEDTLSALRYAQKLAVATGCQVQVSIASGGYTLNLRATMCTSGAFTGNVAHPSGDPTYSKAAPSGLTLSPTTLTFNGLGQVLGGVDASVALNGASGSRVITIVAETGFIF